MTTAAGNDADADSTTVRASADAEFDRLPAIANALNRFEWAGLIAVAMLLAPGTVEPDVAALRLRGIDVPTSYVNLAAVCETLLVLLLAWPTFRLLDQLPVRAGVRVRNMLLRVVVLLVAYLLHEFVARTALLGAGPLLGLDPRIYAGGLTWHHLVRGPLDGVLELLLAHVVMQRMHRSRFRQRRAAELAASLAEARLHALARELQPHFLFNSLNGITALIRDDPAQAESMLVALADLLRLTLEGGDGESPLRAELERTSLYLDLQRMRYGSRLVVHCDVDEAALDASVPTMLLQPLVENAIMHGIAPRPGPGVLRIAARAVSSDRSGHQRLRITVQDDGAGLAPSGALIERAGLGTTRARLAALYGAEFRFTLGTSAEHVGALVTIEIPWRIAPPSVHRRTPRHAAGSIRPADMPVAAPAGRVA